MVDRRLALLALPLLAGVLFTHGALAQDAVSPASRTAAALSVRDLAPVACVDEAEHIQPKFEELLEAASRRDFSAFSEVAGGQGIKSVRFAFLSRGRQNVEEVFAVWSDLANPEKQSATLQIWRAVFDETNDGQRAFRAYFARIERSKWNVWTSASDRVFEDYVVYSYGCDLFLIQQTEFPYLPEGPENG